MKSIKSNYIVTPTGIISGEILIKDGLIHDIIEISDASEETYPGLRILPGIIDTHNHGTMGYGLMGEIEDKEKEVEGYLKGLVSQGVTGVFPTAEYSYFNAIVEVSKRKINGAKIVGIHSEGPYLSRVGEQGIAEEPMPVDIDNVQDMINEAEGLLKLVAIAPELPDAQKAIDLLNENSIKVAYAHSDMNYKEAYNAFDNGVSVATHTANVMSGIHHRNMGGLGACLLHPNVMCELIPDGLHVNVEMMDLMFRVKDYGHWMLVSDTTSLSGAPSGKYTMGSFNLIIDDNGFAKTDTGRLLGSTKPVIYGMNILNKELGIDVVDLCLMASTNPANYYNLENVGSIVKGNMADIIVVDDNFELKYTYIDGEKVYDYKDNKEFFNINFNISK